MVSDRRKRHVVNIHIPEYSAHPEHILTFEIRTVTPAEHLHSEPVGTLLHQCSNVKFGNIVRTLGITRIFPVHPYVGGRIYTVKMQDCAPSGPVLRDVKYPDV